MQPQFRIPRRSSTAGWSKFALVAGLAAIGLTAALILRPEPTEPAPQKQTSSGPTVAANPAPVEMPEPSLKESGTLPVSQRHEWDEIDDPSADGWETERFNDLAGAQLKLVGKLIAGPGPITAKKLTTIASPEVQLANLVPPHLSDVYKGNALTIHHGAGTADGKKIMGLDALALALNSLQHAGAELRLKFKIINVTPVGKSITTRQLVELVAFGKERITEQHATWEITWLPATDKTPPLISSIRLETFEQSQRDSSETLFTDCTAAAIGKLDCYQPQLALGANHWLGRSQDREANSQMGVPGIAIADVDGDGRDDLYLCQNGGLPNRLLLQSADGSLREEAATWGVDWLDASRGVLLIDLDNDGDKDLVVATIGNLVLAENIEQKRFEIRGALPVGDDTTSLAAADFDQDGKLDVYSCVYRHDQVEEGQASEVMVTSGATFVQHDATNGGANSLFRNLGDFEFSDVTKDVGLDANNTRYSFAATWEDIDNDGDLDLYVANDYGRNNLYRNGGAQGFEDIASASIGEDSAFGMGVAAGDYDRDGWMDFYVSNMWSSAGLRVTSQEKFKPGAPEVKERLRRFAQGNTLLRNLGKGEFGAIPDAAGAALGRWAWGSQFVDFNNDGWEDLVVANGFMSAGDDGDL